MKIFSLLFLATILAAIATESFSLSLRADSLKGAILDNGFVLKGRDRDFDRDSSVVKQRGKEVCDVDFEASNNVKELLFSSGEDWAKCNKVVQPISKATSRLATAVEVLHFAAENVEELSGSIAKFAKQVEVTAKASLTKLTTIPKVGQLIKAVIVGIDKAEDALKQADFKVEKVTKILGKLEGVTDKISKAVEAVAITTKSAELALFTASKVESGIIACTDQSAPCSDDLKVENFNKGLVPTAERVKDVSEVCPRVFDKVDAALQKLLSVFDTDVFEKIREALEKLQKFLQPILDKIEDFLGEVGKHLQKAYCCVVPTLGQVLFKGIGQVLDLATCPLDPLTQGLDAAIQAFIDVINDAFLFWVQKALNAIPDIEIPVPKITSGEVDIKSCEFELPTIGIEKISLFREFNDVLDADKPSLKPIKSAFKNIGTSIRDGCKDAAKEVGKGLLEDCCKLFEPLPDGHRCDPLNKIPFRRCSQCTSGSFSLDFQQVSTVCGKRSLKKEFIELGDDIKDAGRKVGKGVKTAAKTVGRAAKKIGKRFKKAFG